MISFTDSNRYWSYYLAIENQLENISRYIEFDDSNQFTYSIELARILLSASSEVDVLMKQFCKLLDSSSRTSSINAYRECVTTLCPNFARENAYIGRFGLSMSPWDNWIGSTNPDWWTGYNKVKHHRDEHFTKANLKNAINAVAALHILVVYFYKYDFSLKAGISISFCQVTRDLVPESSFIRLGSEFYYANLMA